MLAVYFSAITYLLATVGLVAFMLIVSYLLGGRFSGSQKEDILAGGTAQKTFHSLSFKVYGKEQSYGEHIIIIPKIINL